jgi:Zn-dependent metalloprotease
MNSTRSFAAKSLRLAFAAMFSVVTFTANAGPGQESNATLINFSASEKLQATDAARILSQRLELRAGLDELHSVYVEHPGMGVEVQRFNQYFKGIRVAHGTYTLTSKDGLASYAFGKYFNIDATTSIAPAMSETDAIAKAMEAIGAHKYMWQQDPEVPAPVGTLQFVEDFSSGTPDNKLRLAYAIEVYAAEPLSRTMVFVDANTGKILLRDAILQTVAAKGKSLYSDTVNFEAKLTGSTYTLEDYSRGNTSKAQAIITRNANNGTSTSAALNVTSTSTIFPRDASIDAHWGATIVYDYWKNNQNRLSWNGKDSSLKSYVHWSTNYINASWNGQFMVYGDGGSGYGAFTALDVCGHEIGHGVCQSTAGLVYSGESGAMNEGFSDIWGAAIEDYGNPHESDAVAKNTWLIGEELGYPLRSMANPKLYGQPNTYGGISWIYTGSGCDNSNDNCGVHTNSGVLNYWFYLVSVGGKGTNDNGNPYQVAGIGITKGAKIAYQTELALTNTSNYAACRAASIAAATTLYGACSPEVEAVTRAWYAVGVGTDYVSCTPVVSFGSTNTTFDENASINSCSASHTVNLPIVLNGPAPSGGNAVVTVTPIGGTAVAGVDYDLPSNTVTFNAGSASSQSLAITVYDNGSLSAANKYIDLVLSLTPNGSNLVKATILDTVRVTISNDDMSPLTGGTEQRVIGASGTTPANNSSPFLSAYASGHGQYIYTATELAAAGVRPGVPITEAAFYVLTKYSTQPFNGYTVKMGHTTQNSFTISGFVSPSFTTVYSGNYTTAAGWNTITFTTPFAWDGTSNIVVEVCYTNSSASGANDRVQASSGGAYAAATGSNSASGCGLSMASGSNISYYRPIIRFTHTLPPAPVASKVGDTRSWKVRSNQVAHFYTQPKHEIIASIISDGTDLDCITAQVTASGNGFVPASGGKVRSVKEYSITSTKTITNDSFDVVLYYSNDELAGADLNVIYIVQTTSANDFNLLPTNTSIVGYNDITYGDTWTAFRGTFKGLGRFYLTNGQLALGVGGVKGNENALWTGANPFITSPVLHWNLGSQEHVTIRLSDVTGKTVYSADRTLETGAHSLELSSSSNYAPGTYILQVIRQDGVFTRKMVKQ